MVPSLTLERISRTKRHQSIGSLAATNQEEVQSACATKLQLSQESSHATNAQLGVHAKPLSKGLLPSGFFLIEFNPKLRGLTEAELAFDMGSMVEQLAADAAGNDVAPVFLEVVTGNGIVDPTNVLEAASLGWASDMVASWTTRFDPSAILTIRCPLQCAGAESINEVISILLVFNKLSLIWCWHRHEQVRFMYSSLTAESSMELLIHREEFEVEPRLRKLAFSVYRSLCGTTNADWVGCTWILSVTDTDLDFLVMTWMM